MTNPMYPLTERQARFVEMARALAEKFNARAAQHDREGTFPFENFADLRAGGYPSWAVPARYGGWGANLLEGVMIAETLAEGDGSTALAAVMHLQTLSNAEERRHWPEPLFAEVCRAAVERGALVNFIATEPEMGSPSHGGKPATTATPVAAKGSRPAGYLINGRKNFASMSPTLDYMIASATIQNTREGASIENGVPAGEVANFVIAPGPGVTIEETWDSLGMRSTGSHDVIFCDVFVPTSHMIPPSPPNPPGTKPRVNAWFTMMVSSVYVGVAAAALQSAIHFAQHRVPPSLGKPLTELENVQRRLGEAELLLHQARTQLYHAAELWDRYPDRRAEVGELVLVAKYTATNNSVDAVDQCMRVAGGASMTKALPLERYYRDVRGGVGHPMHDDQILTTLGKAAIARKKLE
jgi:alkylation response protein AidB-like acyl-CoA dehydrogenase